MHYFVNGRVGWGVSWQNGNMGGLLNIPRTLFKLVLNPNTSPSLSNSRLEPRKRPYCHKILKLLHENLPQLVRAINLISLGELF